MNDVLSSMIAFIGFIIIFSTLVQAVQEAFKDGLKLRARVWQRFLVNIYKKEFALPDISVSTSEKIKASCKYALSGDFVGEFDERLKRLKNIVDKSVNSLRALRQMINEVAAVAPSSGETASLIAEKLGPLDKKVKEVTGYQLDTLLNIYDRYSGNKITSFYNALKQFDQELSNAANPASDNVAALRLKAEEMAKQIDEIERMMEHYQQQIEDKLNYWLAQVNAEFKRNMLKWTIIIGTLFVGIFNADSFTIYKHLGVDSKTRAAILEKVAENTARTQQSSSDDLLEIDSAIKNQKPEEAKTTIIKLAGGLKKDFETFGAKDMAEQAQKVMSETENIDIKSEQAIGILKDKEGDVSRLFLILKKRVIDYQTADISSLDLPLGWTSDWNALISSKGSDFTILLLKKIGGLSLTIFLITFGAPFWNNILSVLIGIKTKALSRPQ